MVPSKDLDKQLEKMCNRQLTWQQSHLSSS